MDTNINNPLISVIMPVYNGEKYLTESIDSVLGQSFTDFELIIIDDGSKDNSLRIIEKYLKDRRIRLVRHGSNMGFDQTVNEGMALARGKYVARMDCDDICDRERLEKQVEFIERNKDIDICGTWAKAIDESGNYLFDMKTLSGFWLRYNFWKPSPFIHPSILMRKDVASKCNFLGDFSPCEDYELWLRLGRIYRFDNLKEFLMKYRINQKGMSKKEPAKTMENSRRAFEKNIGVICKDVNEYSSLVCKEFRLGWHSRWALLTKLSKVITYPRWIMIIDNSYYWIRKNMFTIMPGLRRF